MFEEGNAPPEVSLNGASSAAALPAVPGSNNKLAALAWKTAIHKQPDPNSFVLGYLRAGAVVSASEQPVGHKDCRDGWYRIAPFGYVCIANNNATLDLEHELVRALSRRPDVSSPLPYMYGTVRRPGAIYARLPSREEASAAEPGHEERMQAWFDLDDHNGASFRADAWLRWKSLNEVPDPKLLWESRANTDIPWFLADGRTPPGNLHNLIEKKNDLVVGRMMRHQGFAFVDTVVRDGRRYGITTRLLALPVDRLRPIRGARFHGYEIPGEIDFPFALVRARNAYAYKIENGRRTKAMKLKRRAAIKLTDKKTFHGKVLHYQTVDGYWLSDREVSRLDPARRMPAWGKNGERWLDVNITKQTLVAYDGTKAVFATLVSTGEAGLGDPKTTKSTKRGIFRIDRKHVTATMNSDKVGEEFELRDIPYVQYFEGGYALHAAYWHNDFGTPRSHGCINLSPVDARRLFYWTEPKIPPGWHTVRRPLTGSVIFVHP
ncbi:MAG: L,D-transpeptidase [Myxococcota bacterium]